MLLKYLPFLIVLPPLFYSLISLYSAYKYLRNKLRMNPSRPEASVSILKPVKGGNEASYGNFASFCCQEYSGEVQLVFALASPDDPSVKIIKKLIENFPNSDIKLVINPSIHGANYKVSNLINGFPETKHNVIIISDCDIRVPHNYLRSVTKYFTNRRVGLVTSLYRTTQVHGIANTLEAIGFTAEMIPNVLVAEQVEGVTFALGASMAVRRDVLKESGGFEGLVDYLADDYQLGNRVYAAGWDIVIDRCFVESVSRRENLMTMFSRQLRWAKTVRVSRPAGYLASGITLSFPAAILATLFASTFFDGLLAVAILYSVRMFVCTLFSQIFVKDKLLPRWLFLLPLRDMLTFFSWAFSFTGSRVEWRGASFRLSKSGKIEEIV